MMTLCLELPLIIGDKVPEDNNHWTLFLILIRICSIALSPICSPDLIAYLRVIIFKSTSVVFRNYIRENVNP